MNSPADNPNLIPSWCVALLWFWMLLLATYVLWPKQHQPVEGISVPGDCLEAQGRIPVARPGVKLQFDNDKWCISDGVKWRELR